MKSMAPPGASGTMKRTGRFGHSAAPWARAAPAPAMASPVAAAPLMNPRRAILLMSLPHKTLLCCAATVARPKAADSGGGTAFGRFAAP
jgi:hypothetical protein